MRRAAVAAILLLAALELVLLIAFRERRPHPGLLPPPARFQKGVVLGLFARNEPGYLERNLDEIRELGADSVSIALPWVTPDVRSTRIRPRGDMTPTDESLRRAIAEAHARGMRVLLLPVVYVDEMAPGEWRGALAPGDWRAWFMSYRRMILHYARIAQSERVECFSVGSELCSTEARREDWLRIISDVRGVYQGVLTYSANWDHREEVRFADALDALGLNAYFELSDDPEAGVEDLVSAWAPIRRDIDAWQGRIGKDLIFTEVGYPSRTGAASHPWSYDEPGEADPAIQDRCYRAFIKTWTGDPALAGVYFYMWWGEGGPGDTGYTPRGKPAVRVMAAWFKSGRAGGAR